MKKKRFITLWLSVCMIGTSCSVPKDSAVVLCLAETERWAQTESKSDLRDSALHDQRTESYDIGTGISYTALDSMRLPLGQLEDSRTCFFQQLK